LNGLRPPFLPVLEWLANHALSTETTWHDWRVLPVPGGANGLLYHLIGETGEYAVKFTPRDRRDRAGREYRALRLVERWDNDLAPQAVWLDQDSYPQSVVVQTWVQGETLQQPPGQEQDWRALVACFHAIHQINPYQERAFLNRAVINFHSAAQARGHIHNQIERVPPAHRPEVLQRLVRRLDAERLPVWPRPRLALCRTDANYRNFIRRMPGPAGGIRLATVDWENSGWGDPIFELADLRWHPAYAEVPPQHWDWVLACYLDTCPDPWARLRLAAYLRLLAIWWVARFARYLYELPRGLDPRIAVPPAFALEQMQARLERYGRLAAEIWLGHAPAQS